ncbi:alpha/beta hydrolase family protein [Aquibacillus salsiterrae]|uniref:Acetylxylan esterase n=1 Tax=Aquibacillus salsiterrae TaxID=2950439 RepID=A0A9X3WAZ4_9BACI|nr:alpha/beta hydrolase family protein [Aquibacillus salsiterrae]MDC3416072.1 acetylxylan esterase [Aquibacillus salsiterrae]
MIDSFFEQIYLDTVNETGNGNGELQRNKRRQQIDALMGDFRDYNVKVTNVQVVGTVEYDEYTRQKLMFQFAKDLTGSTYVLTPKNDRDIHPTVLAIHGHGYGNKEIVGLTKEGEEDNNNQSGIYQHFAVQLVKRGMKVIAPEVLGFGERRLSEDIEDDKPSSCEPMATQLLMTGRTLAGLRVTETRRLIDWVETMEDVDKKRIGMMGFSGGGLIAAFTAALDNRIKATVISGFTNTFKGSILAIHHCIDNYVPGILEISELPEIIGLIAPRGLFVEGGHDDPIFPVKHTKLAIAQLEAIYRDMYDYPDRFSYDIFEGSHQIGGEKSYDWLRNYLLNI